MPYTAEQVMEFVQQEDVKFIRLAFFDALGRQKNISVAPCQLYRAFTHGVPFHPFGVDGFDEAGYSLRLFPVPDTFILLPRCFGEDKSIRMYCYIRCPDGTPFQGDSREILHRAAKAAEKMGLSLRFGMEYTFYLLNTDAEGNSTGTPHDRAGYLDTAPLDKGEPIRREICLTLEQMGVFPLLSQHHYGPGQHLIRCCTDRVMKAADGAADLRAAVHAVACRKGLYASFAPKPLPKSVGSDLYIYVTAGTSGSQRMDSFFAGIQAHLRDMTVFFNPAGQSYERLHALQTGNRMIPACMREKEPVSRIALYSPDPAANPYILLALLIHAGLDGIRRRLSPSEVFPFDKLPHSAQEAFRFAQISGFIGSVLPRQVIDTYLHAGF